MKRFIKNTKNSKLNLVTIVISIIALIIYLIGLGYLIYKKYSVENVLSISANYVSVCSYIIILIQLIAFVKDSRHKEFRCRKEAALNLAKEYAENILSNITFIQTVLCVHYNKDNPDELMKIVKNAKLDAFTLNALNKNNDYDKLKNVFINKNNDIDLSLIFSQSIAGKIPIFNDVSNTVFASNNDAMQEIANVRFRANLCDTMNTLEYFAMSVNQNVAESEMLYVSLHQTFLLFVRFVYPFICKQNIDDDELYYPNVIKLYRKWNSINLENERIKKESEQKRKEEINRKKDQSVPL